MHIYTSSINNGDAAAASDRLAELPIITHGVVRTISRVSMPLYIRNSIWQAQETGLNSINLLIPGNELFQES